MFYRYVKIQKSYSRQEASKFRDEVFCFKLSFKNISFLYIRLVLDGQREYVSRLMNVWKKTGIMKDIASFQNTFQVLFFICFFMYMNIAYTNK